MTAEHNEETLGRILREVGQMRTDFTSFREKSNTEMADVRAIAIQARETANAALRVAETSANDTRMTQTLVIEHTKGLAEGMKRQDKDIADIKGDVDSIKAETKGQTGSIDLLVKAEDARKIREDALVKAAEDRWKSIGRWWPIVTAAAAGTVSVVAYIVAHWKP